MKRFLISFFFTFAIIIAIIFMIDLISIFGRANENTDLQFYHFIFFSLLKMPKYGEQVLVFYLLIASIHHFLHLANHNEINIYKTNGYSIWSLMIPHLSIALLLGIFYALLYNPLSSRAYNMWEKYEATYFEGSSSTKLIDFNKDHFWVRSNDGEYDTIINAASNLNRGLTLLNVNFYRINKENKLEMLISAPFATLRDGYWAIENATIIKTDQKPFTKTIYKLSTKFTVDQIEKSFLSPNSIPIWELPDFISKADASALPSYRYKAELYKLLFYPLTFFITISIALIFCTKHTRIYGKVLSVTYSLLLGLSYYLLQHFMQLLYSTKALPISIVIISPSILFLIIIFTYIFYNEEQ